MLLVSEADHFIDQRPDRGWSVKPRARMSTNFAAALMLFTFAFIALVRAGSSSTSS